MNKTAFAIRLSKSAVTGVGLLTLVIVFNNLNDYYAAYDRIL
jgi:predicted small integral membrane protein